MNRLMRAEWYRVRKTYHLSVWAVALCVFMIYLGYMDVGFDGASSGIEAFGMFLEKDLMLITYLTLIIAGMYVTSYENKVLCYEVMAGNRTSRLLLSKLFTVVPLMSVISIALMISPITIHDTVLWGEEWLWRHKISCAQNIDSCGGLYQGAQLFGAHHDNI